ncbi:MAG: signal recognition particle protein, partial [Clostridia bacterium]|nr:signal recognition particle protein [Clostridia bacterium]
MALFASLSERLNHIFSKLTKRGRLTELEIKTAMREVRVALLEADVNIKVAKQFCAEVSEKAVGQKILESLNPAQQVIKIVNEELIALMGSQNAKLTVAPNPPTVIMMCGLQGAGKTTLCGKLALLLKKGGKKPLLVGCDVYRPAAIEQLKVVGKNVQVEVFEKGTQNPVKTAPQAIEYAKSMGYDTVIIDTAGRLEIDEALMQELENIKKAVRVDEILLTVDSMMGQVAVNVAKTFNERLEVTGIVLTKLDGDTRGGACLSIKAVTGKPIKFIGVGEKSTDLEYFYPDRMASRILGMGDVLSLIEKAQEAVTAEEAKKMQKKMLENTFTLEDYLTQFESMKKMGGAQALVSMMPGLGGKIKDGDIDESKIERTRAIILS